MSRITSAPTVVVSPVNGESTTKTRKRENVNHTGEPSLGNPALPPVSENRAPAAVAETGRTPHAALAAHLIQTRSAREGSILPESIVERLEKYAPELAGQVKELPAESFSLYYHGGNIPPASYHPVLVSDTNQYSATQPDERSWSEAYMCGKMFNDSLLWRSDDGPDRLANLRRVGHEYYGILTELSVPSSFYGKSWEFRDNLMINDFLFAKRIGTYNLKKLSAATTKDEEHAAIEWFSASDFLEKFIPAEARVPLLGLKRSASELRHDYGAFEGIQTRVKQSRAARGIDQVDGLLFTHHQGFAMHSVRSLYFRYRDSAGEVQTLPLDHNTRITVDGETTAYDRRMTGGTDARLSWKLPGGHQVTIGKRAKVPDKATNGKPVSFDFGFDADGNLAISISTD